MVWFFLYFLLTAVDTEEQHIRKNVTIGPAVLEVNTTSWRIPFYCTGGRYLYGARASFDSDDPLGDILEPYCHTLTGQEDEQLGSCQKYVIGFQASWVPSLGLSFLQVECENHETISIFDNRVTCSSESLMQPRHTCPTGYGVCGFQQAFSLRENLLFICCKLTDEEFEGSVPSNMTIDDEVYETIGPVNTEDPEFKPNEPYLCEGYAYGLDVDKSESVPYLQPKIEFTLKCGQKQEVLMKDCPWFMNGVQVEIRSGQISELQIHCYDGSLRRVYKDQGLKKNVSNSIHKEFQCSQSKAVCGYLMDENFLENFVLLCCELNEDDLLIDMPTPTIRFEQLYYNNYTVGLVQARKDTNFGVDDFNRRLHPLVKSILLGIERELSILKLNASLIYMKSFHPVTKLKPGIMDNRNITTFQLFVRYEKYVFRLDQLRQVAQAGICSSLEGSNVDDCRCTFDGGIQQKRDCTYYWRLFGMATEESLYSRTHEDDSTFVVKNRNGQAEIYLGLVGRPFLYDELLLNGYDDWLDNDFTTGYIETIENYFCPYNFGSIKPFEYTKRWDEKTLYSKPNSTNIYLYFQAVASCKPGFVFFFDTYRDIEFSDGTHTNELTINCQIPLAIGVRHDTVKFHCKRLPDSSDADFTIPPPRPTTTTLPTTTSTQGTTTIASTTTAKTTTTQKPKLEAPADVLVVLDGCRNTTNDAFNFTKEFLVNLIRACPAKSYGLIEFSRAVKITGLHASLSTEEREQKIRALRKSDEQERNAHLALADALEIFEYHGSTNTSLIIYISFGDASNVGLMMFQAANIKKKGIQMLTLFTPAENTDDPEDSDEKPPVFRPPIATKPYGEYIFTDLFQLLGSWSKFACKICSADTPFKLRGTLLIFLLDGTSTSNRTDFDRVKEVFTNITQFCPLNRFALIEFSEEAQLALSPTEGILIGNQIVNLTRSNTTKRNSLKAFELAEILSFEPSEPIGKTVIYASFGRTRKPTEATRKAYDLKKRVRIIAMSVTEDKQMENELRTFTGVSENAFLYEPTMNETEVASELACQICYTT